MKINNVFALTLFVILICFANQISGQTSEGSKADGKLNYINGVVTDITGARISGATITLKSPDFKKSVDTTEDGTYEFWVRSGIFTIQAEHYGFCPLVRPSFQLQDDSSIKLNFTLLVCPIVNSILIENGKYKGEIDSYEQNIKSEILRPLAFQSEVLVQFGESLRKKDVIEYKQKLQKGGKSIPVTFMYDVFTISAEKIIFDQEKIEFIAEGKVLFDNGRKQIQLENAKVRLENGKLIIEPLC